MLDLRSAKILFKEAEEMGLSPKWLINYGLFSIQFKGKNAYVFYTSTLLNSQLGAYLAKNKHATRVILEKNNIPGVPFSVAETPKELEIFLKKYKTIIAKPTMGRGSSDIHLINSIKDSQGLNFQNYIFEKFIKGREVRYLVLDKRIIGVSERAKEKISYPKKLWSKKLSDIAIKTAKVLHLRFAAVDFLIDNRGHAQILEVNASPGLYRFQNPSRGPKINLARIILEETLRTLTKN